MRFFLNQTLLKTCHTLSRCLHLDFSPDAKLSKKLWDRYRKLSPNCKVRTTYVWIDGTGENLRSKTKTMDYTPSSHKDCPNWDFDGSSTFQAEMKASEVILCPVALYPDPFAQGNNKLVLCETYDTEGKPGKSNHRHKCNATLNQVCDKEPMFGFEQEFLFMDQTQKPFGWPVMSGEFSTAGSYYCSVGADKAIGREISDIHSLACLYCGIDLAVANAGNVPSQWKFTTGPTAGLKAGDDLWMARYILSRIAEQFGVSISLHPKLYPNWHGSGCYLNFSTKEMREDGGYKFIEDAMKKLEPKHPEHMKVYDPKGGEYNKLRMRGIDGTASFDKFTWGVADRSCSVKIKKKVEQQKKGYFGDRRPAANCDPYQVIDVTVSTLCLNK